jgi:hypothetical protein
MMVCVSPEIVLTNLCSNPSDRVGKQLFGCRARRRAGSSGSCAALNPKLSRRLRPIGSVSTLDLISQPAVVCSLTLYCLERNTTDARVWNRPPNCHTQDVPTHI